MAKCGAVSAGSGGTTSFAALPTIVSCPDPTDFFMMGRGTSAGNYTTGRISYKDLFSCQSACSGCGTSVSTYPIKYYDVTFFAQGSISAGELLLKHNATRDLTTYTNFSGSRFTTETAVSATVTMPLLYQVPGSTTTTLINFVFNPTSLVAVHGSHAARYLPQYTEYYMYAPANPQGMSNVAFTLNHKASISGLTGANQVSTVTQADLASINASISTLSVQLSAYKVSNNSQVSSLYVSVSDLHVADANLSARIDNVSAFLSGVSGIPAITSALVDISVLQQQRTSINNKISATSVALDNRISAVSNALGSQISTLSVTHANDIVAVYASVSDLRVEDVNLSVRIDNVSALLSGVSGVPAITSLQAKVSTLQIQRTSINNELASVCGVLATSISNVSVRLNQRISIVSAKLDTSVVVYQKALLSISAAYDNWTIWCNPSAGATNTRVFFKGGLNQNGRGVNLVQAHSSKTVSIVPTGVSGITVRSRSDRFTTNGQYAVFSLIQINSSVALAAGDLV